MYTNAHLAEAKAEAELFLLKHPRNEHRSTIRFIRAETLFYYNDYQAAIADYDLLLRDEIDPVLRAESLLHKASAIIIWGLPPSTGVISNAHLRVRFRVLQVLRIALDGKNLRRGWTIPQR
jgi:hypothetical protein